MANTLSKTGQSDDWRERVVWPTQENALAKFMEKVGPVVFWPLYRLECVGLDHIPRQGPCILAPNHINNFDPVITSLYTPRHPFFMTKKELYKNGFLRWFLRQWGAFPVDRGQRDVWAMEQAGRVLQAGQMLCMFPEGTRSKHGARLGKAKLGTAKLALEYNVPVLPTAITGTQHIRPGFRRHKVLVTMQVDEPLDLVALAGPPPYDLEILRKMTLVLMKRIAAMLPPEYRGVYA
jgi:1-acyl-sn-glycerol-3-phosphate acyltransferase